MKKSKTYRKARRSDPVATAVMVMSIAAVLVIATLVISSRQGRQSDRVVAKAGDKPLAQDVPNRDTEPNGITKNQDSRRPSASGTANALPQKLPVSSQADELVGSSQAGPKSDQGAMAGKGIPDGGVPGGRKDAESAPTKPLDLLALGGGPDAQIYAGVLHYLSAGSDLTNSELPFDNGREVLPRPLQSLIAIWSKRFDVLDDAARVRKMRLVIPAAIAGGQAYILAVKDRKVILEFGKGGYEYDWKSFSLKDQARIFCQIAASGKPSQIDTQLAFVSQIIVDDSIQAMIQQKLYESSWPEATQEEFRDLLRYSKANKTLQVVLSGREAHAKGDGDALSEAIRAAESIKDPSPAMTEEIERLKSLAMTMPSKTQPLDGGGRPGAPTLVLTDIDTTFPRLKELKAFSHVVGSWTVGKRGLNNEGDASLERKGLDKFESVKVVFSPTTNKGTVSIQLTGLTILVDLERSVWQVRSRQATLPEQPIAILPRKENVLSVSYDGERNNTTIDLNNGMHSVAIRNKGSPDEMQIKTANGAAITIAELVFSGAPELLK